MEIHTHTNKKTKMDKKAALSRKNTVEDLNVTQPQTMLRSHNDKDSMEFTQTQTCNRWLMDATDDLETNPNSYGHLTFNKGKNQQQQQQRNKNPPNPTGIKGSLCNK